MSYLERTLYWFLKERVFGGIKKLKEKYFFPFAILIAVFATITTTLAILYHMNLFVTLEFVQKILILQLFVSFALIIAGFFVGKIKHFVLYLILTFGIIGGFVFIFFLFNWSYQQPLFQYSKIVILLVWVAISCTSLFFLMLYFFTSFPKKVMMMGAPKGHVFFSPIIKLVLIISIPIYLYMLSQFSIASIFISGFGITIAIILYRIVQKAPKKIETRPGLSNYAGALGFFYIFLFYHLISSFSYTSLQLSSLIIDILLLFIMILYIVQSLTRRITASPERVKEFENPIRFQTRIYLTDRLKKALGEPGLVLIVMGLALGYQMVYLDSFFITEYPILSDFFTRGLNLSALYHRIYIIISFIVIIASFLAFKTSKRFQELLTDKYTVAQVMKYVNFYFKRQEGGVSPFEFGVQQLGKKLGDNIKNLGDKWKKNIQDKLDNLGKPQKELPDDESK